MVLQEKDTKEEKDMGGEEKVEVGNPGWDKSRYLPMPVIVVMLAFSQVLEPVLGKVLAVAEHAIHFTFRLKCNFIIVIILYKFVFWSKNHCLLLPVMRATRRRQF